jgi:hypothetical protein
VEETTSCTQESGGKERGGGGKGEGGRARRREGTAAKYCPCPASDVVCGVPPATDGWPNQGAKAMPALTVGRQLWTRSCPSVLVLADGMSVYTPVHCPPTCAHKHEFALSRSLARSLPQRTIQEGLSLPVLATALVWQSKKQKGFRRDLGVLDTAAG